MKLGILVFLIGGNFFLILQLVSSLVGGLGGVEV